MTFLHDTINGRAIQHAPIVTGPMVPGAVPKIVLHTTEGSSLEGANTTLTENQDEPHFLLDTQSGECIQYVSLEQFSRSLEHPVGTPSTNAGGCIQIEMVGFAADTPDWSAHQYHTIAELCYLITGHVPVMPTADKKFVAEGAERVGQSHWVRAHGFFGHEHVPNNTHTDPGAFDIEHLFRSMHSLRAK
jgi:hypothetical protein